ncbi:hypothetical protein Bca52824_032655 [Brassica carinata]|uniref:HMA domain-containing protein n=1 Tax=Brassica carinata TaxID=52824 RepID=A0A8X7V6E5_BRACI|nr:hypothetical protein Bca52824_032655 [Brassica carinata]
MVNTDQPVRACVLKVNVKCCSGCENGAKRKLQRLPGVSAAEYNVQKGLMTVTGNVDPMTLVNKLTSSNKKTDLVSTHGTCKAHCKEEGGVLKKYLLLGCLRRKPKVVQPFPLAKRVFGSTRFGNGTSDHGGYGNALANARRPPPPPFDGPMIPHQQYHQMMMQQRQPLQAPQFQMIGAPMHMIQSGPPQNIPYFLEKEDPQYKAAAAMSMFPQPPKPDPKMLVNNGIHYSGK